MTREEAIQWLKRIKECHIREYEYDSRGTLGSKVSALLQINKALDMAISALSAEPKVVGDIVSRGDTRRVVTVTEPSDLISRADAIKGIQDGYCACVSDCIDEINKLPNMGTDCTEFIDWIRKVVVDEELWNLNAVGYGEIICRKLVKIGALATTEKPPYYYVPSADRPTVIRAKTFMRKEDFDKWAEDIKKQGENVICIPCDAEVASADRPSGEWLRKEKEYNDCDGHRAYYWYECSECGAKPPKDQWKNEWHSPYCPSCGARMKGGAE